MWPPVAVATDNAICNINEGMLAWRRNVACCSLQCKWHAVWVKRGFLPVDVTSLQLTTAMWHRARRQGSMAAGGAVRPWGRWSYRDEKADLAFVKGPPPPVQLLLLPNTKPQTRLWPSPCVCGLLSDSEELLGVRQGELRGWLRAEGGGSRGEGIITVCNFRLIWICHVSDFRFGLLPADDGKNNLLPVCVQRTHFSVALESSFYCKLKLYSKSIIKVNNK